MGSSTEGISNYQKCIVIFFIFWYFLEKVVDFDLAEVAISLNEFHPKEVLEIFVGSAHYWGVVLQIDFFAWFNGFNCFDWDVLGIAKT